MGKWLDKFKEIDKPTEDLPINSYKQDLINKLKKDQKNDEDQLDLYKELLSNLENKVSERAYTILHLMQKFKEE